MKDLKLDFVGFETAKLLKEKDFFNETFEAPHPLVYVHSFTPDGKENWGVFSKEHYPAPQQSLIMSILREDFDLHFAIEPQAWQYPEDVLHFTGYGVSIFKGRPFDCVFTHKYRIKKYKDACEFLIKACIEHFKRNENGEAEISFEKEVV